MKSQAGANFISRERGVRGIRPNQPIEIQPIESSLKRLKSGAVKRLLRYDEELFKQLLKDYDVPTCYGRYQSVMQCWQSCKDEISCIKCTNKGI